MVIAFAVVVGLQMLFGHDVGEALTFAAAMVVFAVVSKRVLPRVARTPDGVERSPRLSIVLAVVAIVAGVLILWAVR